MQGSPDQMELEGTTVNGISLYYKDIVIPRVNPSEERVVYEKHGKSDRGFGVTLYVARSIDVFSASPYIIDSQEAFEHLRESPVLVDRSTKTIVIELNGEDAVLARDLWAFEQEVLNAVRENPSMFMLEAPWVPNCPRSERPFWREAFNPDQYSMLDDTLLDRLEDEAFNSEGYFRFLNYDQWKQVTGNDPDEIIYFERPPNPGFADDLLPEPQIVDYDAEDREASAKQRVVFYNSFLTDRDAYWNLWYSHYVDCRTKHFQELPTVVVPSPAEFKGDSGGNNRDYRDPERGEGKKRKRGERVPTGEDPKLKAVKVTLDFSLDSFVLDSEEGEKNANFIDLTHSSHSGQSPGSGYAVLELTGNLFHADNGSLQSVEARTQSGVQVIFPLVRLPIDVIVMLVRDMDFRDYSSLEQVMIGKSPAGRSRERVRNKMARAWIVLFQRDYPFHFPVMYDPDSSENMKKYYAEVLNERAAIKRLGGPGVADRPTGLWKLAYEAIVKASRVVATPSDDSSYSIEYESKKGWFGVVFLGPTMMTTKRLEFDPLSGGEYTAVRFENIDEKRTIAIVRNVVLPPKINWKTHRVTFIVSSNELVEYDFIGKELRRRKIETTESILSDLARALRTYADWQEILAAFGNFFVRFKFREGLSVDVISYQIPMMTFIVNDNYIVGWTPERLTVYDRNTMEVIGYIDESIDSHFSGSRYRPLIFLDETTFCLRDWLLFSISKEETDPRKALVPVALVDERIKLGSEPYTTPFQISENRWNLGDIWITKETTGDTTRYVLENANGFSYSIMGRIDVSSRRRFRDHLLVVSVYTPGGQLVSGAIPSAVGQFKPGDYCKNPRCPEIRMPVYNCNACGATICSEHCLVAHKCAQRQVV